jgi:hypothetical protein
METIKEKLGYSPQFPAEREDPVPHPKSLMEMDT